MSDNAELEALAYQVEQLQMQIDAVQTQVKPHTEACKPLRAQIKELKAQQAELKLRMCPVMKRAECKRVRSDHVDLQYNPNSKKMLPMKAPLFKLALAAYFEPRRMAVDVDELAEFIEQYRKDNKVVSETVSVKRRKVDADAGHTARAEDAPDDDDDEEEEQAVASVQPFQY
jgi:small-conductance mechanosensitive channel